MQYWKLFLNKFAQTPLPGSLENSHTETHTLPAMKIAAIKQRLAKKRAHFHAGGVGRRPMLHSLTNKGREYPKMDLKMYKLQAQASSL